MVRKFLSSAFSYLFTDGQPPKLKGFLVFTVNVGQLPPFKAEAFCERLKDQLVKQRQDPGWQVIVMPVRPPQETKFEVVIVDGDETAGAVEARRLKALTDCWTPEPVEPAEEDDVTPSLEEVKDYVLLMLGAPVVKIELDEQQIKHCFDTAVHEVMECPVVVPSSMVSRGALAFAKVVLGRVRSKYVNTNAPSIMDGATLLAEGERDLYNWRQELKTA
jgi:hypothetical protein